MKTSTKPLFTGRDLGAAFVRSKLRFLEAAAALVLKTAHPFVLAIRAVPTAIGIPHVCHQLLMPHRNMLVNQDAPTAALVARVA